MFMGYSFDRWIGLGEYCLIVIVLGIAASFLSVYLTNYSMKEELKRNKLYTTKKLHKKDKKYFIDVA
jgi:F0F1-type ATP synthase assembly protein I